MSRSKATLLIFLGIGLFASCFGIWLGAAIGSFWGFVLGLILGLFVLVALASLYSLLAWIFGWPKLRGTHPSDILEFFLTLLP